MATYRVTAPDGKVYDVTPPEGSNPSHDDILAEVQRQHGQTKVEEDQWAPMKQAAATAGSGLLAGISSVPETLANVFNPRGLSAQITDAMNGGNDARNAVAATSLDLPGTLERHGMNAPQPTDPVQRGIYDLARNVGAGAPFAPVVGPAPILLGSTTGAAAGETAHALAPNSPLAEEAANLAGSMAGGWLGTRNPYSRAPTNEQLRASAEQSYHDAEQAGVIVRPNGLQRLNQTITTDLANFGYDPALHPRVGVVLNRLNDATQNNMTLKGVDLIRRVAQNAAQSADASERAIGARVINHIDDFLGTLRPSEVLAGNAIEGARAIREARGYWSRLRKSEDIDLALGKADRRAASTNSGGNTDNTIRQNIRSILDSPAKARNFNANERLMMERVVRGGPVQNLLRLVGKFSPQGSATASAFGLFSTATAPGVGWIPSAAGLIAKPIAQGMTARNAARLSQAVRSGPAAPGNGALQFVPQPGAILPAAAGAAMASQAQQPAPIPPPALAPALAPQQKPQAALLPARPSRAWTGMGGPDYTQPADGPAGVNDWSLKREGYGHNRGGAGYTVGTFRSGEQARTGKPTSENDPETVRRMADQAAAELAAMGPQQAQADPNAPMAWASRGAGDQSQIIPEQRNTQDAIALLKSMNADYAKLNESWRGARGVTLAESRGQSNRERGRFSEQVTQMRAGNQSMNELERAQQDEQDREYQRRIEERRKMIANLLADLTRMRTHPADAPHASAPRNF